MDIKQFIIKSTDGDKLIVSKEELDQYLPDYQVEYIIKNDNTVEYYHHLSEEQKTEVKRVVERSKSILSIHSPVKIILDNVLETKVIEVREEKMGDINILIKSFILQGE